MTLLPRKLLSIVDIDAIDSYYNLHIQCIFRSKFQVQFLFDKARILNERHHIMILSQGSFSSLCVYAHQIFVAKM